MPAPGPPAGPPPASTLLVYDGGCPFCRHFALVSELRGGVPGLRIVDGRADSALRRRLSRQGLNLADGAILLEGDQAWHGAEAISRLCARLQPSDPLLALLRSLFSNPRRSRLGYPLLLAARRAALALQGLPVDPERSAPRP